MTGPHGLQHMQVKHRHCMQMQAEAKPQSKVAVHETQGEGVTHCKESEVDGANPGLQDKGFELNKVSPVCIRAYEPDLMTMIMMINIFFVTGIICRLTSYP